MIESNSNQNNNVIKDVKHFSDEIIPTSSKLPEKEYVERNSLLTDLYENKQVLTIYRLVLIIVVNIFLNNIVYDSYNEQGQSLYAFIIAGFSNFHYAILIWTGMFLSSFIPYYGLVLWANVTIKLPPESPVRKRWNITALLVAILHHVLFLTSVPIIINYYELPVSLAMALLCDAIRISMKTYALIRSNAPRVFKYKPHVEDQDILYPTVKHFLYFSFIPATVYRDNYPRNKTINWSNVFIYMTEFIGAVLSMSFLAKLFFINPLYDYGLRQFESKELLIIFVKGYLAALLITFHVFYIVFHAWLNLFAELLRFSDRMFYKDWWTSENGDRFHRTWNIAVHDWLYNYIYKDLYDNVLPKNKFILKTLVFFVSSAFHEYVLAFPCGFFLPTFFFSFFVINVPILLIKLESEAVGNFFGLVGLGFLASANMQAQVMEYFCRVNSPPESITWTYLFTPQLFNCIK